MHACMHMQKRSNVEIIEKAFMYTLKIWSDASGRFILLIRTVSQFC